MAVRRYPSYKPSGAEWLGEIPEHWKSTRLKYLVGLRNEKSADICTMTVALENIESGTGVILPSTNETPLEGEVKRFEKDDVLFNKLRPYLAKVVQAPSSGCCVGELLVFIPNELTSRFLFYRLISSAFITEVNSSTYGSKMPRASWEDFISHLRLPYPVKSEQQIITDYLDHKTALIDKAIQRKQRLIELLQEDRTALINQAVTRGLNPDVKLKPSGIEWLGDVPEHWEVKKLKYITRRVMTGSTPPSNKEEYYALGTVNWYTPGDFSDNFILQGSNRKLNSLVIDDDAIETYPPNTVLFVGIGATLGKSAISSDSCSSNQQINAVVFDETKVIPMYGLFYLRANAHILVMLSNSATLPILNQSQAKNLFLTVPPFEEQAQIVAEILNKTGEIQQLISSEQKSILLLQEYRTALINEVVTGKVCVVDKPLQESQETVSFTTTSLAKRAELV